jgi:hypothetical protein
MDVLDGSDSRTIGLAYSPGDFDIFVVAQVILNCILLLLMATRVSFPDKMLTQLVCPPHRHRELLPLMVLFLDADAMP